MHTFGLMPQTQNTEHRTQKNRIAEYSDLLKDFNKKLNLISSSTIPEMQERHIEHCLMLTSRAFPDGCSVVDWGTGGGLPAIPLAIQFPEVNFMAVDAVGKKIHAVRAMGRKLGLANLEAWHGRAEAWPGKTHYSVSRATAPLLTLWSWHVRVAQPLEFDAEVHWHHGLICLKGGDLAEEINTLKSRFPGVEVLLTPLHTLHASSFFQEKYIVEVRAGQ